MKRFTLLLMVLTIALSGMADQLQGVVLNKKGKPQKKVKVYSMATKESVVTDGEGKFVFNDIGPADSISVCQSSTKEARFPVDSLTDITVKLDKNNFLVIGGDSETAYDYVKIKVKNRPVNVITREQVEESNAESIYDLLRGRLAGVIVTGETIRVRGTNSFNMNNEPIFVVDGMEYGGAADVDRAINVCDIERVEVMKEGLDYGTRGANGAIIITTIKSHNKKK